MVIDVILIVFVRCAFPSGRSEFHQEWLTGGQTVHHRKLNELPFSVFRRELLQDRVFVLVPIREFYRLVRSTGSELQSAGVQHDLKPLVHSSTHNEVLEG